MSKQVRNGRERIGLLDAAIALDVIGQQDSGLSPERYRKIIERAERETSFGRRATRGKKESDR